MGKTKKIWHFNFLGSAFSRILSSFSFPNLPPPFTEKFRSSDSPTCAASMVASAAALIAVTAAVDR